MIRIDYIRLYIWLEPTARGAYESAPYEVVEKDGNIEIREYPDLMMVATDSRVASMGRDGV